MDTMMMIGYFLNNLNNKKGPNYILSVGKNLFSATLYFHRLLFTCHFPDVYLSTIKRSNVVATDVIWFTL